MAGYDPTGNANATISTATVGRFGFSQDLDGDGDITPGAGNPNENIVFGFSLAANDVNDDGIADAGFAPLGRLVNGAGGYQPIAENIHAIEFYYTLADGSQSLAPANPADIRAVQITVLAQTAQADPKFNASPTFTTPFGTDWTLPLGYRGRMTTMTVQCRNMGL